MSEKQLNFLDELQNLFEKYSIDEMIAENEESSRNVPIQFWSNGQYIQVSSFCLNRFCNCSTYYGDHQRKECDCNVGEESDSI